VDDNTLNQEVNLGEGEKGKFKLFST